MGWQENKCITGKLRKISLYNRWSRHNLTFNELPHMSLLSKLWTYKLNDGLNNWSKNFSVASSLELLLLECLQNGMMY